MAEFLAAPFRWAALMLVGMALAWAEDGWATRPVVALGIATGFLIVATALSLIGGAKSQS